jgi:hypothetical protein
LFSFDSIIVPPGPIPARLPISGQRTNFETGNPKRKSPPQKRAVSSIESQRLPGLLARDLLLLPLQDGHPLAVLEIAIELLVRVEDLSAGNPSVSFYLV